jgi:HEAT repeat protein
MRGLIRRGEMAGIQTREAAWAWMGQGPYRTACAERVMAPALPSVRDLAVEWNGVLAEGHLLASPAREEGLRKIAERLPRGTAGAHGLPIGEDDLARLTPEAQVRLARWAACLAEDDVAAALEPLLGMESTRARLNALRVLGEAGTPDASALALDFCFDASPRVARAGLLRGAIGARAAGDAELNAGVRGTIAALARSEHELVRESAGAFAAMLDPLEESTGRLEARRMLRGNRAGLVRMLQTIVRTGAVGERVRAIRLAGRLGIGSEMELELLSLIAGSTTVPGPDAARAASAAVTVLAELRSPAAQHAVHKCLRHPDDRVRANALDAMARVARRGGWITAGQSPLSKAIVEFKDDPHHRVRAGAARARLLAQERSTGEGEQGGAGHVVVPLLRDQRAMHRVSGLWLAERVTGDGDTAATLAEMMKHDPVPEIRVRARRAAARMLAGMSR